MTSAARVVVERTTPGAAGRKSSFSAAIASSSESAGPRWNEKVEYEPTIRLMLGRIRNDEAATTENSASSTAVSAPASRAIEYTATTVTMNTDSTMYRGPCWYISRLRN